MPHWSWCSREVSNAITHHFPHRSIFGRIGELGKNINEVPIEISAEELFDTIDTPKEPLLVDNLLDDMLHIVFHFDTTMNNTLMIGDVIFSCTGARIIVHILHGNSEQNLFSTYNAGCVDVVRMYSSRTWYRPIYSTLMYYANWNSTAVLNRSLQLRPTLAYHAGGITQIIVEYRPKWHIFGSQVDFSE